MLRSIFFLSTLMLIQTSTYAEVMKAICLGDERRPSNDQKVARIVKDITAKNGCTATLVGPNCLITAGHCRNKVNISQFNVPDSIDGKIQHATGEDSFFLRKIYGHSNDGRGRDWLVYSVEKNRHTNKYPGELYGWYETDKTFPEVRDGVRIAGYGKHINPSLTYTQQSSYGRIVKFYPKSNNIHHTIDTLNGNSGSAIVSVDNNKIIGIHTHGGCNSTGPYLQGANTGTMIYNNHHLKRAIGRCLSAERNK